MASRALAVLTSLLAATLVAGVLVVPASGSEPAVLIPGCTEFPAALVAHPGRTRLVDLNCPGPASTYEDRWIEGPAHGTLTRYAGVDSRLYRYTPDLGYTGPDALTLHGSVGGRVAPPLTVAITVTTAQNTAPSCWGEAAGIGRAGQTRPVHVWQCFDAEGDPVTLTRVTPPGHGTLGTPVVTQDIDANTEWPYTPDAGFSGTDSFVFVAVDDLGAAGAPGTAAVTVKAAGENEDPWCIFMGPGYSQTVHRAGPLAFNCFDRDEDPLTATITTPADHGTVTVVGGSTLQYALEPGYEGTVTYALSVADGEGGVSEPQERTFTVRADQPPTCSDVGFAVPMSVTARRTTTVGLPCSDPDGDPITVVVDAAPAHGTLAIDAAQGTLDYAPDPGYEGEDAVTVHVPGAAGPGTVRLVVSRPPPTPEDPPAHVDPAPPVDPPAIVSAPAPPVVVPPGDPAPKLVAPASRPTAADQAAALLRTGVARLGLGVGAAASGYVTTDRRVALGAPLIAVSCPQGCTLGVDGRVALGGRAPAHVVLAHRTVHVAAGGTGVVRPALTASQRRRVARASRPALELRLKTTASGRSATVRHRFLLAPR